MQGLARPVPTAAFRGSAVVGKLRRGAALSVRGRNGPLTVSAKAGARIIGASWISPLRKGCQHFLEASIPRLFLRSGSPCLPPDWECCSADARMRRLDEALFWSIACRAASRNKRIARYPPRFVHIGHVLTRASHSSLCTAGVGAAVPAAVLTNDDLGKLVDTNDEWISTRTGARATRALEPRLLPISC